MSKESRHRKRGATSRVVHGVFGGALEAVVLLVSLAVVSTSWCLGGVNDIAYAASAVIGFVCLLLIAVDNWNVPTNPGLWSTLLPWMFLLPFLLGALQLAPLPNDLAKTLSPRSAEIRGLLFDGNRADLLRTTSRQGEHVARHSESRPLSLAPSTTRFELARYWVAYSFLLVGMFGLTSRRRRNFFLWLVVVNGGLISFFALIQRLSWNGKLFWRIDVPWSSVLGPFINKNNGGGYLLLVLAAAMSLFALSFTGDSESRQLGVLGPLDRIKFRLYAVLHDNSLIIRYGIFTLLWLAVLISMSRGAFAGAVAATVVTAVTVWRRRIVGVLLMFGITIGLAFALIAWSQQTDLVKQRISSIAESDEYQTTRFLHWGDDLRMANDYLATGVGLGAYQFANRSYQSFKFKAWHRYSENQYLESLIVGGVTGFVLLLLFLACTLKAIRQLARNKQRQSMQMATLGTFALVGQMVAGFFDFGLYNAANSVLMACLIGIVLGCSAQVASPNRLWSKISYRAWLVTSLALGLFAIAELGSYANVERAMHWSSRKAAVANAGPYTSSANIEQEIGQLGSALKMCQGHSLGHLRLANLHIIRFRLALYHELRSLSGKHISDEDLWAFTEPFVVYSKVRNNSASESTDLAKEFLEPAWSSLVKARALNGMIPRVHYLMALLEPVVKPDGIDTERHIRRLVFLAATDSDALFNAGMVLASSGERAKGLRLIQEATSLEHVMPKHVATFARRYLTPNELVNLVCPADSDFILDVVQRHFNDKDRDSAWQVALGTRAAELLVVKSSDSATSKDHFSLGLANYYRGQSQAACKHLELAIKEQPGIATWRLAFAKSLALAGETSAALREAKLSLRLDPKSWRARQLIHELQVEVQIQRRSRG